MFQYFSVPVFALFGTVGILSAVVTACSSVYNSTAKIISKIASFEFDKQERESGLQSAINDLTLQIHYQPIQFTVGGFYIITKSFLASVIRQ